ncbi:phospho-acceptor domain-containing protein [Bacteriovorax stolpii]|nr:ATP-binding protein [Bacteriovorax stolpii]TDP52756.1 phospho-acceptor domain-containing protein [Bacteriovorax stolpii]
MLLGGFVYESYNSYKTQIHKAETETENLSRVLQEHIDSSFHSTDLVLLELQHIIQRARSEGVKFPNEFFNRLFLERRLRLPQVRSFKAIDKNGNYIVDDGGLQNYKTVKDREYFQFLKNNPAVEMHISKPVISKTNHIWVVVVARKMLDKNGKFDGLVIGSIPLSYFKGQFEKLDLGKDGLIGLYDINLLTHVRIPWYVEQVGRTIPQSERYKNFVKSSDSLITTEAQSPVDGVKRILTIRKLSLYPYVVSVGISADQVLKEWKKRTVIYLVFMMMVVIGFAAFLIMYLWSQSELEAQRQQAIQASKLSSLGEMASGVAHEINNPLTIISALATRTKKNLRDPNVPQEKNEENLDRIIATVDRIAKIIRGLRAFSRDSNGDAFARKRVSEIVGMALELCQEKFRDNGIEIKLELGPEVEIECREVQIVQVLVNLLNNSLDAIQQFPVKWVKISVSETEEKVVIHVTDSGLGIKKEVADQMMLPFYTTKDIGKGTGLGLSISKGIIEAHEGKFYYRREDSHTSFVIELKKSLNKI